MTNQTINSLTIDYASNAVWGADWVRAKKNGAAELAASYENIIKQQATNDPEALKVAIINKMVSGGHSLEIASTVKQDMLQAVQESKNFVNTQAAVDPLAIHAGWNSKVELNPTEIAGALLDSQWETSGKDHSLADLWRAGEAGASTSRLGEAGTGTGTIEALPTSSNLALASATADPGSSPTTGDISVKATWETDLERAKANSNDELVSIYEGIIEEQTLNDPEVLRVANLNAAVSSGHSLEIGANAKKDMVAALKETRNYIPPQAAPDALSVSLGWTTVPELVPNDIAGRLLDDLWSGSNKTLSLAELWRLSLASTQTT